MKRHTITIKVGGETKARLVNLCNHMGYTISHLIAEAVADWMALYGHLDQANDFGGRRGLRRVYTGVVAVDRDQSTVGPYTGPDKVGEDMPDRLA